MTRSIRIFRHGMWAAASLLLLVLILAKLEETADSLVSGPFHAIDGDTLAAGVERLRLDGLDAPELGQTCRNAEGKPWACGEEARRLLALLLAADGRAECAGRDRDRYGRLLVRCQAGKESINAALVRRGLAIASGSYGQEEAAARRERQGLWVGSFETPRDWRASRGMMDDTAFLDRLTGWMKAGAALAGLNWE